MISGVGYSDSPDSALAGKQAAERALLQAGQSGPCDLVLLFCTSRHNQAALREAVLSVVSANGSPPPPVYGGGAAGVITNDYYGYAGDQVGVACLWLENARCDAVVDRALQEGETPAGVRLGRGLARLGVKPDSPVLFLYESVAENDGSGVRMVMADWILSGLEQSLGFLPDLFGAGMIGDHVCGVTGQYSGADAGRHRAVALVWSGGVSVDSVVMHGCVPASEYFTVTKADGPVILEIDHTPALDFIDGLLGSSVAPEQYPFFLLFGVNSGERWDAGPLTGKHYASRLCLGIDRARGGIVMFEPDMTEGTEFQLMFRSGSLDYVAEELEALFRRVEQEGREPAFALFIDCAGRCAGYAGTDVEDALILQKAVAGRVPVLGVYTGVEIASVSGRPRVLDWSGVFCLFSRASAEGAARQTAPERPAVRAASPALPAPGAAGGDTPVEALRALARQNAAQAVLMDIQSVALRYELELRRRGFRLLSELSVSLRSTNDYERIFLYVAERINAALNMQKTTVLMIDAHSRRFFPTVLRGFGAADLKHLRGRGVDVPPELLESRSVIVNSLSPPGTLAGLSEQLDLPFFITSPVFLEGKVAALLITGRMVEQEPYLTRLSHGDLETVEAVTELLGSVLVRLRLQDVSREADTDGLTGFWNRGAFQRAVENHLANLEPGAFMMIDMDHFKDVNDTYGHIAGDGVLRDSAAAMRSALRGTDIIGRQGGDEFVVFCCGIGDGETARNKAAQLSAALRSVSPGGGAGHITVSVGIALAPLHGRSFKELYGSADIALYRAKRQGRDRCVLFGG